ncbi:hypothetical protein ACZ91_64320 [Streptomyces regensis]|nr:hypothetical protein ACZ91_64320 [Streptomyces regensis]
MTTGAKKPAGAGFHRPRHRGLLQARTSQRGEGGAQEWSTHLISEHRPDGPVVARSTRDSRRSADRDPQDGRLDE